MSTQKLPTKIRRRTVKLTMAIATDDDVDSTINFLMALEALAENNFKLKDWHRYKDSEKQTDRDFYRTLHNCTNQNNAPDLDNLLDTFTENHSYKWRRVVFGYTSLYNTFCDKKARHLATRPDILKAYKLLRFLNRNLNKGQSILLSPNGATHKKIKSILNADKQNDLKNT